MWQIILLLTIWYWNEIFSMEEKIYIYRKILLLFNDSRLITWGLNDRKVAGNGINFLAFLETILFHTFHSSFYSQHKVVYAPVTLVHRLLIKRYKGPVLLFVWRPLENATTQRIRNTIFNDTSRKSLWSRNKQLAMEIRKEENTQSIPRGWKKIIVNRSSNEIE